MSKNSEETKKYTLSRLYYWLVGYRSRITYWSGSKIAAWIRDNTGVTNKPKSDTMKGWREWHKANKSKFGYWLVEEGLDYLQNTWMFIPDIYNRVRIYIRNRFIDKTHYLDTKLKRGDWYEFDTRLLHGMFEALVTFVEDEKAAMMRWSHDEKFKLPNMEKGIEYLKWEMTLKNHDPDSDPNTPDDQGSGVKSRQAERAEETLKLYNWWKTIRPLREEPGEDVGLWDFYNKRRDTDGDDLWAILSENLSNEDEKEHRRLLDASNDVETFQYNEDTEMMIRLIKLRESLWT